MPLRTRVALGGGAVTGGGVSTMYWRSLSAPPSTSELQGIADALENFWTTLVDGTTGGLLRVAPNFDGLVEDVDLVTGQITDVYSTGTFSIPALTTGTNVSRATQGLIQWRTGHFVGGRELRGRTYVPGIATGHMDGSGSFDSSFTAKMGTAADALPLATAGLDYWLVGYSRTHATEAPITSHSEPVKPAVLRSRRD